MRHIVVVKLIEARYRVVIGVAKLMLIFIIFVFGQKSLTFIHSLLRIISSIGAKTIDFEVEVQNYDAQQDVVQEV